MWPRPQARTKWCQVRKEGGFRIEDIEVKSVVFGLFFRTKRAYFDALDADEFCLIVSGFGESAFFNDVFFCVVCGILAAGGKKKGKDDYRCYDGFVHVKSPLGGLGGFFVPYE